MKLLINISALRPPLTGIGRYTINLLHHLLQDRSITAVSAIHQGRLLSPDELTRLLEACDNHREAAPGIEHRLRRTLANLPGTRALYSLTQQKRFIHSTRELKDHVYWEPGYFLLPHAGPGVATLFDLSHISHPQFHPRSRVSELNRRLPFTLTHATRLITISRFVKQEIEQQLAPEQSIDLVPPGVDEVFFNTTPEQLNACRQRYSLPHRYLLSVATLEPRKNLIGLLQAYRQLPTGLRNRYPLVLAGAHGWNNHDLNRLITPLRDSGHIITPGYVEQKHIPALFAGASASVYVSHYEGFGMPIAESMAAGTPVITSDCSAMPEVADGNALLVNPDQPIQIRDCIMQLLENPALRQQLSAQGRIRARQLNWQTSARQLRQSLEAAQQAHRPGTPEPDNSMC